MTRSGNRPARLRLTTGVALLAALPLAACSGSGSGGRGANPTPTGPGSPSPTQTFDIDVSRDAVVDLPGSATVTLNGQAPVTLSSSPGQPVEVGLSPGKDATVAISMRNTQGDVFSLAAPARVGSPVAQGQASIFLQSLGAFLSTDAGNTCSTTYTQISEKALVGDTVCSDGNGRTVHVRFHAG